MPRTHIYVDGFNLYYGLVKDGPYKWLNLEKYFTRIRQHDQVLKILYFTAMVSGPTRSNQIEYLRALETLKTIEIIKGKLVSRQVTCKVPRCNYTGIRIFNSAEEKGTDVNIAVRMIDDAFHNRCDNFVLVSGDSDLAPALRFIKHQFPKKQLFVYIPVRQSHRLERHNRILASIADKYNFTPDGLLKHSQFPDTFQDSSGQTISKPSGW
ncbi:MAG: NYN domain-containing protein [bacterium]|nr:NYN domain-containing protein [bacterium]